MRSIDCSGRSPRRRSTAELHLHIDGKLASPTAAEAEAITIANVDMHGGGSDATTPARVVTDIDTVLAYVDDQRATFGANQPARSVLALLR